MDLETVNSEQGIVNSEDKDKQIGQETCTVIAIPGFSCHSPFTIHHSPFTIHHSPFTIHHSPFNIHHSPFTIHHSPFTIHHSPFTV